MKNRPRVWIISVRNIHIYELLYKLIDTYDGIYQTTIMVTILVFG